MERPNRFIARIELDGELRVCHVKNTGRCRELLVPGAEIYVQERDIPSRKTKYDLIAVRKGGLLVNVDSQAPNIAFGEYAAEGRFLPGLTLIKPESVFHSSRFDFYMEAPGKRIFAEVKGVTLEEDGLALFPDAPTRRGLKHLEELIECAGAGYEAYIVFVIQMKGARFFSPNRRTHPEFADALKQASALGVHALALDCLVTEDSMSLDSPVEVRL